MKFFRLSAAAVAIVFASTAAPNARAESNWLTDYKMAQQEAKANNKLLLLDFTGSDWCGWCIKLNKEVFSKPEFKDYANKNLVLMEVDFPRGKSQGSDIKKQNEGLAQQYQIEGFPATWRADPPRSSRNWKSCAKAKSGQCAGFVRPI